MIRKYTRRSLFIGALAVFFALTGLVLVFRSSNEKEESENGEEYENVMERYEQLREQMKDPVTGEVPNDRLLEANRYTANQKSLTASRTNSLTWTERGPIYDSLGPSNGNYRNGNTTGGGGFTSGMLTAFLVDTLNDATGNTVFAGSPGGGLWKCTNFLSTSAPNWLSVNQYMQNIAIGSICQHPSNGNILYMATGDANQQDIRGYGVWKSTDAGASWALLPTTTSFNAAYKIVCDASGNVYLATGGSYLRRSTDGGATWVNIAPSSSTASNPNYVTDIELSSTGRMHIAMGWIGTVVNHFYTDAPATATTASGWTQGTGLPVSGFTATRLELACKGNILYAVTSNTSYNIDYSYKSVDGGATWTKQNSAAYTNSLGSGQGYYNITLQINPTNTSEFLVGGLDAYRSTDNGLTISAVSNWVNNPPYVHADHHNMMWWQVGSEGRVIIACDGGLFLSRDGGINWRDRNQNLAIKQFYACAIHPAAGSNYLLGGAQDNGSHQLKNAGLSYSFEVVGGDGCFVHINQQNPAIQYCTYVYNQYRRSVNGGSTWSSVNYSTSNGYFVNPFDYDDAQNIMYASYAVRSTPNNKIARWTNANTSGVAGFSQITFPDLARFSANGNASSFKYSTSTANRLFIGSNRGKLLRIENANTVVDATASANTTDITGPAFPDGYLNCVNTGSSDQYLVAVFSNYGVNNLWYSIDGGSNWTAIDGNLPDMPIWWAAFEPGNDNRMVIATEAGIYTTQAINGSSTAWTANPSFPTVRTTMLKIRNSDKMVVASTYGRGLWTAPLPNNNTPEINFTTPGSLVKEDQIGLSGCRGYRDYTINVSMVNPPTGDATVIYSVQASNTATLGKDFDFTTNGNFNSPSTQQVFTNGTTGVKAVTIRVYDDGEVEPDESFTLAFTISGTTDALVGTTAGTHTFTVQDNDAAPAGPSVLSNTSTSLYTANVSTQVPLRSNKIKHRIQCLYTATELRTAGFTPGASFTAMNVYVATKNSTKPYMGFTISLANTNLTNLSAGFIAGSFTQIYSGDYTSLTGYNTFNFSAPFAWDGASNIVVQYCFDNGVASADAAADVMAGNGSPLGTNVIASAYSDYTSGATSGCTLPVAFISPARIYAEFSATLPGTPIASILNTTKSQTLGGATDQYFYSASGEIIARIQNASGFNYGCTPVTLDRAGTGASPFWSNNAANYLASKTFRVVPTTNNTSGQYQITLYYTAAEKAGWEAATGQSWNNIKLVKVKSQISNYTPATPAPDGANAVDIVTPVLGTLGSNYTVTGTFSSGFSGFGVGIPGNNPLPVTLLNFSGRLDKNTALLNWSTSAEQNSKNFAIEKSTDGVNYATIGTVPAAGNSSTQKDYGITDTKLSKLNYYRLRMNDLDGRNKLSQVVLLQHNAAGQNVWVVNNPFRNYLDIRTARDASIVRLQLIGAGGNLIEEKTFTNTSGFIHWPLSKDISNGAYLLRSIVDGTVYTNKLMKQ